MYIGTNNWFILKAIYERRWESIRRRGTFVSREHLKRRNQSLIKLYEAIKSTQETHFRRFKIKEKLEKKTGSRRLIALQKKSLIGLLSIRRFENYG